MSRIIAGDLKSLTLAAPANSTRPTSDRVRESLFAVLESQGWLSQCDSVLDLYCGTGALALEAISRGVSHATLVDDSAAAIAVTKSNCQKLQAALAKQTEKARVVTLNPVRAKVASWLRTNQEQKFDLVFADPPYELSDADMWLQLREVKRVMAAGGLLIVERSKRRSTEAQPDWLSPAFTRLWGDTEVSGYRLRSEGPT